MSALKKEFEKFYKANIDKVFRFVFFRCQDRELAEDLVSEIFIKVLNNFESYDSTRSQSAWVMTIAKNHLANYWRDRKVTVPIEGTDEDDDSEEDGHWLKSALFEAEKQANKRFTYELLAKIPPEEAEIVTLHYIIGYSYSEIAAIQSKTEGAVKVAAHRIIKKLQSLV